MKIFTHNFNPHSNSGPNKFSRQLFSNLIKDFKVEIVEDQNDADIEFALIQLESFNKKPLVLRLDGIYFNSDQDFELQNKPIKLTFEKSDAVIYQSEFNKILTEKWFGKHSNGHVIHNAADIDKIREVNPIVFNEQILNESEIWCCASSWRPHKRLEENLKFFCEKSSNDSYMIVAGSNADLGVIQKYSALSNNRVLYAGELDYTTLLSLYKRSSTFVHLAYLDHCPNVVVDAQASGCHIVCSTSGGTKEIVSDGTVVIDKDWDFSPTKLYQPPPLDFSEYYLIRKENERSIKSTASKYYKLFETIN